MTSQHVEIAVAKHFGYRQNLIVPNVHWGLGLAYEADMAELAAMRIWSLKETLSAKGRTA